MFAISISPAMAAKPYLSASKNAPIWCSWIFHESSRLSVSAAGGSSKSCRGSTFKGAAAEDQVTATGVGDQAGGAERVERTGDTFAAGADHARDLFLSKINLNFDDIARVTAGLRGELVKGPDHAARHVAGEQAFRLVISAGERRSEDLKDFVKGGTVVMQSVEDLRVGDGGGFCVLEAMARSRLGDTEAHSSPATSPLLRRS